MRTLRVWFLVPSILLFLARMAAADQSKGFSIQSNGMRDWPVAGKLCPVPEAPVVWLILVGIGAVIVAVLLRRLKERRKDLSRPP